MILNPRATTSRAARRVVEQAVRSARQDLSVVETQYRMHATEIARDAARGDFDLVVAVGGDGTVNEVLNGMFTDGPRDDLPALAIVPGGQANVVARSLGYSNLPLEALGQVLENIAARQTRKITVGRADERWFAFTAGMGLDAAVLKRVEEERAKGQRASSFLYSNCAVKEFYGSTNRFQQAITLDIPGQAPIPRVAQVILSNTTPWTYAGIWPIDPNPDATFEGGLDLFAMKRLDSLTTFWTLSQIVQVPGRPRGPHLIRRHNLWELTVRARRPTPFQLDGEYIGERTAVSIRAFPAALTVVA